MNDSPEARIFLVSAMASGQGKTTVTAALARKLARRNLRVRVFKAGPDFLDPMLLEHAGGTPVQSLDLWMVGAERCRFLLAQAARAADIILIEGVMGLYDGNPSSADLARAFGVPVLAVIDAAAMAQTAGAVAAGLRDFGPVELAGVIANRVGSPGHAAMVAAAMRGIPLLGTLPRQTRSLPERHLGLMQPSEIGRLDALLDSLAQELVIDEAAWSGLCPVRIDDAPPAIAPARALHGKVIAVARDAAFAFLYPANLECLHELGARLVFFSPLADETLPAHAHAVYLPGGYPELHAATLSGASNWQASIRHAHAHDMPIWAECGGMMALADAVIDQTGKAWPMAGLMPGCVSMQPRLAGLGLQGWETSRGVLRGHAFHYSRIETTLAPIAHTVKHPSGTAGEAVYRSGSLTASYFHGYFPSCPAAVAALFCADGRPA